MSETTNNASKPRSTGDAVHVEKGAIDLEGLEGFTPEEIGRMLRVKDEISKGRYSELTPEYRKLLFVEWLIEHGKLKS